ncbi:protein ABCI7, chloroplastic [Malus domestica]|uniref:protein ABCI7, chloroplastic n=1 Tax=Malus domestica TaxID=3750 RepID=UPI0004992AE4|nr:protein ABCI7, chloroplastic [Malus domestica]XP_028964286.1 protein ABCI7, chloroplastic [Malus domestica]XP_028964287.1 protein ABCI7, chloroplastic [Malus domestica]XP_028964288.1 protein ABCI7, chloroplastic [Malus domestica]XP_028964289.1 protein ABCI7, chloroplastic [Malus domestica]XP_028964290.1 protein ABCI7, chloroplastic [Malus domestica]
MAAISFTTHIQRPPVPLFSTPKIPKTKLRVSTQASPTSQVALSDPFVLQLAEALEDSLPSSYASSPLPLQNLRDSSSEALLSTPWPSRKDEPFRFTDTSFIKNSQIQPISHPPTFSSILEDTQIPNLVIVDGFVVSFSNLSELPDGVYVGSFQQLSEQTVMERVSEFVSSSCRGDLFWSINGIGAPDVTVIYVPSGCRVETPVYLRYFANEGSDEGSNKLPLANPRVLVLVEKGGEIGIIEEFLGGDGDKCYWTNSVFEVVVGEGGKVTHSYVQNQSLNAAHIKWTWVHQESASTYELVEVSTGGKLSRHNLHVQQLGPDTVTELSTLQLSVGDQTHDLHSSVVLDHPRGYSRQLHKCIVSHSLGQAVFDGNIRVNRYAQQTDGGQLTRSLLLAPRATVNVKPNLQIIADDVKCSHGCAISDLEESQLFYFQARGIDVEAARKALLFSFGAEVIERLPYNWMKKNVENQIRELLDPTTNTGSA